ncbi:hypothetical protein MTP99_002680 [Tenebrio molitor]|nr:hypothetical protein MTP99_002680 [Tenebrio molitor]
MKVTIIFVLIAAVFVLTASAFSIAEQESEYEFGRSKRASCVDNICRLECKLRHPSYTGWCIKGQCDCF